MNQSSSWSESMLARMDRWSKQSHWLPGPDERLPGNVFWGIFLWNLPFLAVALGIIGFGFYRVDPDPAGRGMFLPVNWIVELLAFSVGFATLVDMGACLWLRHLWNRRARQLAIED